MSKQPIEPQLRYRLAVLLSGGGSNFKAIHAACKAGELKAGELALVVSNQADAGGLAYAQAEGLPTFLLERNQYANRQAADDALLSTLKTHAIDWVILAGYNRILSQALVEAYAGRLLNIHPSLLPKFGGKGMLGLAVHKAVLAAGETQSGCTVHYVTLGVDEGSMVAQTRVPVWPDDTPEILASRVLEQEHWLYSRAIQQELSKQ
jgi:formyltetrahydrofolate-dependent phosphoribosylglycinamide formyltransferase